MKTLYLAWQDPVDRMWRTVGRLTLDNGKYKFVYTKGAKNAPRFSTFGGMKKLDQPYESTELFPVFANRLLSERRPEYEDYLKWANLSRHDITGVLSATGGKRVTDSFRVFPKPEPTPEERYEVTFFAHGLRYFPEEARRRVDALQAGERLYLMPDPQNEYDPMAILLRTGDPLFLAGYCPRFFATDFKQLLQLNPDQPAVVVIRVNRDAPLQMRLLCRLSSPWPAGFETCSGEEYKPLVEEPTVVGRVQPWKWTQKT